MAVTASNAIFEKKGVAALHEHIHIVIGLQESRIALTEVIHHSFAYAADVCKHPYRISVAMDEETVRVCGIVVLPERSDFQVGHPHGLQIGQRMQQAIGYCQPATGPGTIRKKYRQLVFIGQYAQSLYVVAMLVGYEDSLYMLHRQPLPCHPFLGFAARYTGIYQNCLGAIANVIAIAIAA